MNAILKILLTALAVGIADYLIPGVSLQNWWTALVAGVVMGLINGLIRPVILLLTFPITVVTLGLFTLAINALMVMLAAAIVPGFEVAGFWSALLFSLVVSVVEMFFGRMDRKP